MISEERGIEYPYSEKREEYDWERHFKQPPKHFWRRNILWRLLQLIIVYNLCKTVYQLSAYSSEGKVKHSGPTPDEMAFLKTLEDSNLAGNWSKEYTSIPHLAGQGIELVNWTASKFEEYGLETEVETFDIYLNYPVDNGVTLFEKDEPIFKANLTEDVLAEDSTTDGDDLVPAFHGYSASGNVTAQYVYVNYGSKEDFKVLESSGVSLKGRIAIARYGGIFRGLKVKFAQEAGAVGVLIYSDPGDDHFQEANGDIPYPLGPARNPSSLQRGSVQFLSQFPGDPTTPGRPSQGDNVVRDDPYESIPKIPSLPISFREVKPILEKLNGHGLEASVIGGDQWVGNIPGFDYWTGPNRDTSLNLYNEQKYDIVPIYNVYGTLKGTNDKDGHIIIGNHRDAWIKGGASDPNSGSATTLEIIRSLHELSKAGWKPYRTIKFASWDGEEYGLLGSTEFGEKNAEELKSKVLAYLNVDVSVGGRRLGVSSSPFLNKAITEALHLVEYPLEKNVTLHDHLFNHSKIGILGSGSDYTVFLEHLGISSLDMGFTASFEDPVYHYHSNYDSYHWMSTLQDPGFKLHNAAAKALGIIALRLSESKVVNTNVHDYSRELLGYFEAIKQNVPSSWLNVTDHKGKSLTQLLNKTTKKLHEFDTSAELYDEYLMNLRAQWDHANLLPFWKRIVLHFKIIHVNFKLRFFERHFIHEKGLKGRSWFKHIVYAAGRNTGYEGFALPGLKEALDDAEVKDFIHWNKVLFKTVSHLIHTFRTK